MKQKLLNSVRLRAAMLVAILCAPFSGTAWGETKTATLNLNSSISSPTTVNGVTFTWSSPNIAVNGGASSGFKASSNYTTTMKKIYMQSQTAIHQVELTAVLLQLSKVELSNDSENALGSGDILTKDGGDWNIWNE